MSWTLATLGHATLVVSKDGRPLIATDPWLTGSVYWRSWWLEKPPRADEIDLVRRAAGLYVTHTHPDHFHLPSFRQLGPRHVLVPLLPQAALADGLRRLGSRVDVLAPWTWYEVDEDVRIASIPVPIDDSILVVDTPSSTIVNLNDSMPVTGLLRAIRDRLLPPDKPRIVLKSYAPASVAFSIFRGGERQRLKDKKDYALTVQRMSEALSATHYVPFASQAFFSRADSRWANEHKVVYEDLLAEWRSDVALCKPFVTMDLATLEWTSTYGDVKRELSPASAAKVHEREQDEAAFVRPADFDRKLKLYLDEVRFLRLFFRCGIGWRLTSSGEERFYRSSTRSIERAIPADHDIVIELPDKILDEALDRNVLTDLGITMIIRVHTRVPNKVAYGAFLLMGLHDNGHFRDILSMFRLFRFYLPYVFPQLLRIAPIRRSMIGRIGASSRLALSGPLPTA